MSFKYEFKPLTYFRFVITRPWALFVRFYVVFVCFDQVIIVWVLTPRRLVFRHRGFEETCSIHSQLPSFELDRTPAALKMEAVYSTEPYPRVKLRYVASRKTTSQPLYLI